MRSVEYQPAESAQLRGKTLPKSIQDLYEFSQEVQELAKRHGLEVKDDEGQIFWPNFTDDGFLSEWNSIMVRIKVGKNA